MRSFKYKEYTKLMSPDEVEKTRSGSCHDQVFYEMRELRRMGKEPHAIFMIEHNNNNQGGMTHSLVYYKDGNNYIWFENAWSGREGIHRFKNINEIKNSILLAHKTGEYGDINKYGQIEFSEFSDSDHQIGEDLQEFVDRCL